MNITQKNCPYFSCVSIVIPTYNRVRALRRALKSVLNQHIPFNELRCEIILALDSRDNKTEKWINDGHMQSNVLKYTYALLPGVNAARNSGILKAAGDIVYFLDDDCFLIRDNWIVDVWKSFKHYNDAVAIGGRYATGNRRDIYALCRNELSNLYLDVNIDNRHETKALLGGNSGYKREVFDTFGFFDEKILYGSAETEMNDRIVKNNGKMYLIEELTVGHLIAPRSLWFHSMKSFKQGKGKSYSCKKNAIKNIKTEHKQKTAIFFNIKNKVSGNRRKIKCLAFLLFNYIFYRLGLAAGFLFNAEHRSKAGLHE